MACLWLYQSQFANKFYGLERSENENGTVWEFSYYRPHRFWNRYRIVRVPAEDIVKWIVMDDWNGKFLKSALMAQDGSGKTYRSFGVNRKRFRDKYRQRLETLGVAME